MFEVIFALLEIGEFRFRSGDLRFQVFVLGHYMLQFAGEVGEAHLAVQRFWHVSGKRGDFLAQRLDFLIFVQHVSFKHTDLLIFRILQTLKRLLLKCVLLLDRLFLPQINLET